MKKIIFSLATAVMTMLGLSACSSEQMADRQTEQATDKSGEVKFTITTGAKSALTRGATESDSDPTTTVALNREKTVSSLYAVLFYPDAANTLRPGKFCKTVNITSITENSTGNYTCAFDPEIGGLYYMYLVANPTDGLAAKLTGETVNATAPTAALDGDSETSDFFGLTDDNSAPSGNTSTGFLMTSNRVQLDIDGNAVTDLTANDIELTRNAVRIDIDCSKITDFTITQVTFANRYASTKVNNTGSMAGLSVQTPATDYVASTITATSSSGVTDQTWEGVIYGYENLTDTSGSADEDAAETAGATTITITGEKDGLTMSKKVVFKGIQIRRNTLYTIILSEEANTDGEFGKLSYSINVADWSAATNVIWEKSKLTNSTGTPDIYISQVSPYTEVSWYKAGVAADADTQNPTLVSIAQTTTRFKVTVHSKVTGAGLILPASGAVEQVSSEYTQTSDEETGDLIQEYTLEVKNLATVGNNDPLTIKVHNQLNEDNAQIFQIVRGYDDALNFKINKVSGNLTWSGGTGSGDDMVNPTSLSVTRQASEFNIIVTTESAGSTIEVTGDGEGKVAQTGKTTTQISDTELRETYTYTIAATATTTTIPGITFTIKSLANNGTTKTLTVERGFEITKNALWWVSEFNLATIKDVNSATETTFVTAHVTDTSSPYFTFAQAVTTAMSGSAKMDGYHLPTRDELVSVVPSNSSSGAGVSIWETITSTYTATNPYSFNEIACDIGGNSVPGKTSYFYYAETKDHYAIRFVGTDYVSAWHYKWVTSPVNGLLIESFLLDSNDVYDETSAKEALKTIGNSTIWETGGYNINSTMANLRPTDGNKNSVGYVQRFWPACGYSGDSSAPARGLDGRYWCATEQDSSNGYMLNLLSTRNYLNVQQNAKTYNWSIRLFYDN